MAYGRVVLLTPTRVWPRRLLQRCREAEEAIVFETAEGVTLPGDGYFERADEVYELAKSFE